MSRVSKQKEKDKISAYRWRRFVMVAGFAAMICVLFWRAFDLQVLRSDFLQGQGDSRFLRVVNKPAHRGVIGDRNGEPLAVTTPVDSVWVEPAELLQSGQYVVSLATALGLNPDELINRLRERSSREFLYVRRKIAPATAEKVREVKAPGVHFEREYQRFYPDGEVVSHLVGFTDIDDKGQEGLELAYDEWLAGESGSKRVIKDRLGHVIRDVESVSEPRPGNDLLLSIDRRIQYLAYRELKKAVTLHKADSGSAVVLDVTTGEVLAMVNQPAFNPNNRGEYSGERYRNRALTDVFEPGSTIKPFTVAAALEARVARPNEIIETSPGFMRVGKSLVRDFRDYGKVDLATLLKKSSNVAASKLALRMKPENLCGLLSRVGFGQDSGTGFPGEAAGQLEFRDRWHDIERATLSFGYGFNVTTLQLARAYSVLASGGVLRPVSLTRVDKAPEEERILSEKTARFVSSLMTGVLDDDGTASLARVSNYSVAGKTGTTKKPIPGGYSDDKYMSSFAGFAPVSNPRLVMVVVINEPSNGEFYGGKVAGPVFSKVMSGALRILNVAPDELPQQQAKLKKRSGSV